MNFLKPLSGPIEKVLKVPIIFTLFVMYQGLFSHYVVEVPERLEKLFQYESFRFFSLIIIALAITRDVEYALLSTLLFILSLYAIKTPEERKKTGFI
jgi:hypothetical protein